jgi:biotin operon repressor
VKEYIKEELETGNMSISIPTAVASVSNEEEIKKIKQKNKQAFDKAKKRYINGEKLRLQTAESRLQLMNALEKLHELAPKETGEDIHSILDCYGYFETKNRENQIKVLEDVKKCLLSPERLKKVKDHLSKSEKSKK